MKLLSILLSVYMLLLSAVPYHCNGHDALCGNAERPMTVITQNVENHADVDSCIPFRACAGNGHSVDLFAKLFSVTFPVWFSTSIASFYQVNKGISIPLDFWRPPIFC
jgi:hypothetical protein